MSFKGEGHYLTLSKGHSDSKIKTCFFLKSHSEPNFMWELIGEWDWKFIHMSWIIWPRWAPCSYMVKTFFNFFLKNRWPCNLVCSIGYPCTINTVQMMTLVWPWPFLWQGQIWGMLIHRILWKVLKILAWKMVTTVVLMSTWRFVSRRCQGHSQDCP